MSFVNYRSKEINCKIVYYGPGLGGKTTNIQHIYNRTSHEKKGELVSLDNENERTLFFDFLPLELGKIQGYDTRFHLYTVPGQSFYEASRKLILRGVDGVIFVADSQADKLDDNLESLENLKENLKEQNYDINKLPIVMQWNKRDLPNLISVNELEQRLNVAKWPSFQASAISGEGVFETLKLMTKLVLLNIRGAIV